MYRHPETGQLDIRTDTSRFGDNLTDFVNNKNSAGVVQSAGEQRQQRKFVFMMTAGCRGERLSIFYDHMRFRRCCSCGQCDKEAVLMRKFNRGDTLVEVLLGVTILV